jgi:hypothetical protein
MTKTISSHHLINVIIWELESKSSSFESIKINYTINDILKILNKNNICESYIGYNWKPYELKPCVLNEKIVNLFFPKTLFKNVEEFWNHQQFSNYSIHLFNYNHSNNTIPFSITDKCSTWYKLKAQFNIEKSGNNIKWSGMRIKVSKVLD